MFQRSRGTMLDYMLTYCAFNITAVLQDLLHWVMTVPYSFAHQDSFQTRRMLQGNCCKIYPFLICWLKPIKSSRHLLSTIEEHHDPWFFQATLSFVIIQTFSQHCMQNSQLAGLQQEPIKSELKLRTINEIYTSQRDQQMCSTLFLQWR